MNFVVQDSGISTPTLAMTKAPSVLTAELQGPQADGFVADAAAALQHHSLHHGVVNLTVPLRWRSAEDHDVWQRLVGKGKPR